MPETIAKQLIPAQQEEKLALEQLRLALRNLRPNCWLMPILGNPPAEAVLRRRRVRGGIVV